MSLRKFFGFNRLQIGARNYRMTFPLRKNLAGDDWDADIRYDKDMIRLCRDLSRSDAAIALLHELFHGIVENQLGEAHINLPSKWEERVIDALSRGFLPVLAANPKLQRWLGRYRP